MILVNILSILSKPMSAGKSFNAKDEYLEFLESLSGNLKEIEKFIKSQKNISEKLNQAVESVSQLIEDIDKKIDERKNEQPVEANYDRNKSYLQRLIEAVSFRKFDR